MCLFVPGWIEKKTIEGQSYYFNTKKEILSWDKPDALKTAAEKRVDEANLCWIPDKKEGWFALDSVLTCAFATIYLSTSSIQSMY